MGYCNYAASSLLHVLLFGLALGIACPVRREASNFSFYPVDRGENGPARRNPHDHIHKLSKYFVVCPLRQYKGLLSINDYQKLLQQLRRCRLHAMTLATLSTRD